MVVRPGLLSLSEANLDCLTWVVRETRLPSHELVQVVPQEVGTGAASMAIVDAEE